MKKSISILLALMLIFSFAACSKIDSKVDTKEETEKFEKYKPTDDYSKAFKGTKFVEEDETNTLVFSKDGKTFTETYSGNKFTGTWAYDEENDRIELTYDGADYSYKFTVARDENGKITGLSQMEGRNFTPVAK